MASSFGLQLKPLEDLFRLLAIDRRRCVVRVPSPGQYNTSGEPVSGGPASGCGVRKDLYTRTY
jgi:hypothetical protein